MPELPEVETTVRTIKPVLSGLKLKQVLVRNPNLRWKIPTIIKKLKNVSIESITRRAKYILIETKEGVIIIHLGMSGRLSILNKDIEPEKHDHVDFIFNKNITLRYTDPRRFGSIHLVTNNLLQHPLLRDLGPEPLSKDFNAEYLYQALHKRKTMIKQAIMNQKIVVGVGNIYAVEALFEAKISPFRRSSSLNLEECQSLVKAIRSILNQAIKQGGTTLKDFLSPEGKIGYFSRKLLVYGRENKPCVTCDSKILVDRNQQRSTYYCKQCQH